MNILLTPDQESTLFATSAMVVTKESGTYYYTPFYMKSLGGGAYEKVTFDNLPDDVKDMVLQQAGIKTHY
jgi:hypothetical protein